MITITKKEEVVLNQVEIFNPEYPDGVPIKFLKDELGFHEYDLVQILNTLSEKNLIEFNGSSVKLTISDKEINAVKSKKLGRSSKQTEINSTWHKIKYVMCRN